MEDSMAAQVAPVAQPEKQEAVHAVVAEFADAGRLLGAARLARVRGYTSLDAYTPFPVHGLDEALGLRRSRLGYIVLIMGLVGAAAALLLQWWTSAVDYPLVIGGKPPFAFEFSIPITFELTVLFAAFGAVVGMLALNGLPKLYHPVFKHTRFDRAMDDRFLLAIESSGDKFDAADAQATLRALGGQAVEVIAE